MAALAALRPKHEWRAPKKFDKTSFSDSESSDSNAIIKEDSSKSKVNETTDTFTGSTLFFAKCLTVFKGKEKESTIGCDTPYCRHQYFRDVQHLQILLNVKLSVYVV